MGTRRTFLRIELTVAGVLLAATAVADVAPIVISGQVRYEGGMPAANALVMASGEPDARPDAAVPSVCQTRTGDDGRYQISCAGFRWVALQVLSPARAARLSRPGLPTVLVQTVPKHRYTPAASAYTGVDLELPRETSISGTVLDPAGHPLGGVQIGVISSRASMPGPLYRGEAVTDGSGSFVVDGVWTGDQQKVWAFASGFPVAEVSPVAPGARDVRVQLRRGGAVVGRVESLDGTPLPAFKIELQERSANSLLGPSMPVLEHDVKDGTGAFRFDGVAAGRYDLVASAGDRQGCVEDVAVVVPRETQAVTVRVGRISLKGRVVEHHTGRPLGGVTVTRIHLGMRETSDAVTGADGTFTLPAQVPGRAIALAVKPSAAHVQDVHFTPVPATGNEADIGAIPLLEMPKDTDRTADTGIQPGVSARGVFVEWLRPQSPAAMAGVKTGDLIERIDDTSLADLGSGAARVLLRGPAGSRVRVALRRSGGARITVTLKRSKER